jgi:hypothetical protein
MCKIGVKTMIESTIGIAPPIRESHRPLNQVGGESTGRTQSPTSASPQSSCFCWNTC